MYAIHVVCMGRFSCVVNYFTLKAHELGDVTLYVFFD